MVQSLQRGSRAGWQAEESERLFTAVREAAQGGLPLKSVFEQVGRDLNRKPNSIRNYYYQSMREKPEQRLKRAAPFKVFTPEEKHELVRKVLIARGQGMSVRACVMQMAGGDRSLMLRYQNKYRAIMKNRPQQLEEIARQLREEGLPVPSSLAPEKAPPAPAVSAGTTEMLVRDLGDPAVNMMLEGLNALLHRAVKNRQNDKIVELDRLQVRYDLGRMAWEDEERQLKEALSGLMGICRDWLALPLKQREDETERFSGDIAMALSQGESLLTRLNGIE